MADEIQPTEAPVLAGWLIAYTEWFPGAIMRGETQVNDAFRAGYLAAIQDVLKDVRP